MKKSKRLRFYALIQKQSKGELTAAEQTELNELSKLASQHPNAATDEDDTGEGDDKKKKDGDGKDDDGEKKNDDDKKDDDKDKSKAKTKTTLAAVIGAAFASAKAGTGTAVSLAEANKNLATVTGERDQARTDLATAQSGLKTANEQLSLITGYLGLDAKAFAGKDAEAVTGLIGTAVNGLVTEQLGTLGFPAAELPPSTGSDKADSKEDLHRQFNAITDPNKRAAFYAKHSAQLLG
ncbi:MAG: hypothetical protein K0R17_1009 [Rariglobus sp.]|jgi:hypothetical protein|nr:hypothetical protein [Rariglobus sp.]